MGEPLEWASEFSSFDGQQLRTEHSSFRHLLASEVVLQATASWLLYSLSANTQCFFSTGYYFKGCAWWLDLHRRL